MAVIKTPRKKPETTVAAAPESAKKKRAAAPEKMEKPRGVTKTEEQAPEKTPAPAKAATRTRKTPAPALEAPGIPAIETAAPTSHPMATLPPQAAPLQLPLLVQALYLAIQEGRPMEFLFVDGEANAPRTFEPRHLTFDALSQAWFVWGWDRRYNAERHHRVDLLAEVNPVEGVGRAAQGPYPEGTPANLIGGWLGGDPIAVKVTLQKQWVFAVKQAPPAFPNFKIEDQAEGLALVSFTATDLRAIARWVMQFGDGVQVLEPARLVDRVKQVGATWAGRERSLPVPPPPRPAPPAEPAPEPRRHEHKAPSEPRPHREARPEREEAAPPKAGKVEIIRFDRL